MGEPAEVRYADWAYFHGEYATEDDALADLDARVAASNLFHVYREVEGYYLAHRPGRQMKTARIDRILVPTGRLRAQGWEVTIGVEAKRPGTKLGPALAQAIDYTWCIFRAGAAYLYPEWIFLWPLRHPGGPLESIMAQNRVGTAEAGYQGSTMFKAGSANALILRADGECSVHPNLIKGVGIKTGSR
jgi:hypothetical protein